MTLVIMAAGMGSRFGGLKQIEPINKNGEFIIDYSIYDAIKSGFDKVVFIIKKENYDIFRETVGKRVEKHIHVDYVFQEIDALPEGYSVPEGRVKPWGTGHAILCCKDIVKENFAIINSDDFYGRDAFRVISDFLKQDHSQFSYQEYAMAGYYAKNTLTENGAVKRGVCQIKDKYLTGLTESEIIKEGNTLVATALETNEKFTITEDTPVSMNMFAFTPDIFNYLEKRFPEFLDSHKHDIEKCEFLIPTIVFEQIEQNLARVEVLETTAVWQGITYREDKEKVVSEIASLVEAGIYPENLWA